MSFFSLSGIKNINSVMKQCGGKRTWHFSQGVGRSQLIAGDGICAALATHYIAELTHDRHLRTKLRRNKHSCGPVAFYSWVNGTNLYRIKRDFEAWSYDPNMRQKEHTKQFLVGTHGLTHVPMWSVNRSDSTDIKGDITRHLDTVYDCYILLRFHGTGGFGAQNEMSGHEIAIDLVGNNRRFFDPNYGEFTFNSKTNMLRAFPNYFAITGYCLDFSSFWSCDTFWRQRQTR